MRRESGGWSRIAAQSAAFGDLWRHPLTPPFLLFAGLTLLSAVTSGNVGWSLWVARDTLRITIFYLVLWYTRDATHAGRLWQGFLMALTVMATYGLTQAALCGLRRSDLSRAWFSTLCTNPERIRGPFSIYMTFGGVLMLGVLIFVANLANRPWRDVIWMAPAATLTLAALALTYARHAWLGLGAGILTVVATSRPRARIALVAVLVAGLGLTVAPISVRNRLRSSGDPQDVTARDRLAMWQSGLLMVRDHPLLGVGPGQVRTWYPFYRRPEAVRPSTGHLHSSPIHLAAERGLLALGAWLCVWAIFLREATRVLRGLGADRRRERALVSASLAGVVAFLTASLFQHTFGDGGVVMIVYALMAAPFSVQPDRANPEFLRNPELAARPAECQQMSDS